MDFKAFNKISEEAEEAIRERRFLDAVALTRAIVQDLDTEGSAQLLQELQDQYVELLHRHFQADSTPETDVKDPSAEINHLFEDLIILFSRMRFVWLRLKSGTAYGEVSRNLTTDFFGGKATHQLEQLSQYPDGAPLDQTYYESLDNVFNLIWCSHLFAEKTQESAERFNQTSLFTRRTLVSAFLLLELIGYDHVSIYYLLSLGGKALKEMEENGLKDADDSQVQARGQEILDLLLRIAVIFVLIYKRYSHLIQFMPSIQRGIQLFLETEYIRQEMPELFRAFINQSLTDSVDKKVDDTLQLVKEALEKHQPHLGSSDDEESDQKLGEQGFRMEVRAIRIDRNSEERLFRRMMDFSRNIDELRSHEMDVNASSMRFMKHFRFFENPAHWFYPFTTELPLFHDIIYRKGKISTLTRGIMFCNRYCDSDCYSYLSMMEYLHQRGAGKIHEQIQDELERLQDEDDEDDEGFGAGHIDFGQHQEDDDSVEFSDRQLPPLFNYCQSLQRFFTTFPAAKPFNLQETFRLGDELLLPTQPFFQQFFTSFEQIEYTSETLLQMGASREVIILMDWAADTFGINTKLLTLRGYAAMQSQKWSSALSDFQQALLLQEDDEISLSMARCYEALQDWEGALPLLQHEIERQGEAPSSDIIEETARCLIQLSRWDQAAQLFFRLEFMEKHLTVARRGIAWCALHQGKYERAEQYYRQLIQEKKRASWEDYINLGHALWLQGKAAEALDTYRKFVIRFNRTKKEKRGTFTHWTSAFHEDATHLLSTHFSASQIALMLDAINLK